VVPVLESLQREGLPVAVVSNWQCGLGHFCVELGIGHLLDHVVASAEVGRAKPDAEIFREACRRLGTPPERTLHVGDTITDDLDGARNAGLQAILVRQTRGSTDSSLPILDLHRVLEVCESGRIGGEPLEESRG
jgi:HAD superfamily hydrolase (TIGR01509 family)